MKKLIIGVLFLITIGCSQQSSEIPPSMSAIIGDEEYKLETGNFSWEEKIGSTTKVTQTDAASPNQAAEHIDPINMVENGTVDFVTDDDPEITVYLWDEEDRIREITLDNDQLQVPSDGGQYIYEVVGEWSNGEASYTFVVEIE